MITPELAQVISDAIEDRLIDVHVHLPGMVQSYDAAKNTAVIELQVQRLLPTDQRSVFETENLPVLQNVPVAFPGTPEFFFSFPIVAGTTGEVHFSEAAIGQWRATGRVTTPDDIGRHTLSGGVFHPTLKTTAATVPAAQRTDAVFGEIGGTQVHVKKGGACEVTSSGAPGALDFVAMSTKADLIFALIDKVMTSWTPVIGPTVDNGAALKTFWAAQKLVFFPLLEYPDGIPSTASTNLKAD